VGTIRAVTVLAQLGNGGEGPVVLLVTNSVFSGRRSQMVVSGKEGRNAIRRRKAEGISLDPFISILSTGSLVIGCGGGKGVLISAEELALNVLGFSLVKVAELLVLGQNSNIFPGVRVPVRVVVSFFGALVTVSVAIVVLSGKDGRSSALVQASFLLSVSNEETQVSISSLAILVVLEILVHSKEQVSVGVGLSRSSRVVSDGGSGGSISNLDCGSVVVSTAHVLEHNVTPELGVATTMLSSPLNGQEGAFIEAHLRSNTIATFSIVLGVKQSISIVSVGIGLVKSIVGTSRVVHVSVSPHGGGQQIHKSNNKS
jgi:hypothetical protein